MKTYSKYVVAWLIQKWLLNFFLNDKTPPILSKMTSIEKRISFLLIPLINLNSFLWMVNNAKKTYVVHQSNLNKNGFMTLTLFESIRICSRIFMNTYSHTHTHTHTDTHTHTHTHTHIYIYI